MASRSQLRRERRERAARREREAAILAASTPQIIIGSPNPLTVIGAAAAVPRQDAQDGPGARGGGIGLSEASPTGQNAPQGQPVAHRTALFERRDNIRSDAKLVERALRLGWLDKAPKPEHTEAVMTKATAMALEKDAKPHEVIAVTKLHLEYQSRVLSHLHHEDRMDYYERALEQRARDSGMPGAGMQMETDGKSTKVTVYLPNNSRAELEDDLRPEDLLTEDHE